MIKLVFAGMLLVACFMLACDGASQNQDLYEAIAAEKEKEKFLQNHLYTLQKELYTMALRSLKYRFPDIQPVLFQKNHLELAHLSYLKAVEILPTKGQKMFFRFHYEAKESVSPHFTILLFRADGTNIHREEINYKGFIRDKYLKPGAKATQDETLHLFGTTQAAYYLIREKI